MIAADSGTSDGAKTTRPAMGADITATDAAAPGRRERNKAKTRERLLDAARDLLAERGSASTVEEIAVRADVARATFFNYFPSKDDLLTALYDRHMAAFTHNVDAVLAQDLPTAERVMSLFADFTDESASHPGYMQVVTAEIERISASPDVLAERGRAFTAQILRVVETGLHLGEVRDDYPPAFLAQMVAAIYLATIRDWRQTPDYDSPDAFQQAGRFAAESLARR